MSAESDRCFDRNRLMISGDNSEIAALENDLSVFDSQNIVDTRCPSSLSNILWDFKSL